MLCRCYARMPRRIANKIMINTFPISSLDHPELAPYRTLRQPVEHFRAGIFVAEGEKVVARLIASHLTILSVLITPEWLAQYRQMLGERAESVRIFVAEKPLLESIVGYSLHQGIMAIGKIPEPETLDSALARSPHPRLFAAVDGLTNSENLGVLVRNCAAFGVQAIFVGENSSSPYLRRAVRNSMGTVFVLPVVHCTNLVETLRVLSKRHQCRIIGAHPSEKEKTIRDAEFSGDCCVVFGSEGTGISAAVLSECSALAAIPMERNVDSLNVASASAVVLYEVLRQRTQ
jgi:tRNA G18 (ribose-2'-O)-methylase SpoU